MNKTFDELYYIENTPWKRKNDINKLLRFDNIKYNDVIIFHFDFLESIVKTKMLNKNINKTSFIHSINVCLRHYSIIKQLYPYNKIDIIIHIKNNLNYVDISTFQAIIDIIPNFALVSEKDIINIKYFNNNMYKHILYGNCNNVKNMLTNSDYQIWKLLQGKIYIKK